VIWRSLTSDQINTLTSELARSKGSVTISYSQSDTEAIYLAAQIFHIFEAVNRYLIPPQLSPSPATTSPAWNVLIEPWLLSDIIFGIVIPGRDNPTVSALRNSFTKANIRFAKEEMPANIANVSGVVISGGTLKTEAMIFIGSKAPPL
jgi:hypothetical protein